MAGIVELTTEQVLALAPDASARGAARSVAKPKAWQNLGRSEAALWGECTGSALYQVRVSLADLAGKCSCPSRKLPCKHALGLLLMAVEATATIAAAPEPEWVASWMAQRSATMAKKQARSEAPAKPADPKAQERRLEKRRAAVADGVEGLLLFMSDLVRQGLAVLPSHPPSFWEQQAARLVDAQAPGLAARVRAMGEIPGRAGWPETLLAELGTTMLLCRAYQRIDALPVPLRADVLQLVGFTLERDEVIAAGDVARDRWAVIGQVVEDDERLRVQRTWLHGESSRRQALVVQFAFGRAPFPQPLLPGTTLEAELAFWPSAYPLRAIVTDAASSVTQLATRLPGSDAIALLLDEHGAAIAKMPWIARTPWVLRDVVPAPEPWRVIDRSGHAVATARHDGFAMLALSGGRPIDVVGEWDGHALRPLAAFAEGAFHALAS
ncbi:MAG: SWIM zinc finger family protein [Acidobacteriota bacterium]